MDSFIQISFFLPVNGNHLAATCFLPGAAAGGALLIQPFVEERKGTLPVFVQTARALAAEGITALLFDFSGCGDSECDFEAAAPSTFETECAAALDWLAAVCPGLPLFVIGVRTGALLASRLAAARGDVAAVALWSPVSGTDFIRQLLQRRMVNDMVAYGKAQESRVVLEKLLRQNFTVDLDGYLITGAFYVWLQELCPQSVNVPTLAVSGGHDRKTLSAHDSHTTTSELRYPPFWNTVGHVDMGALITMTVTWLLDRVRDQQSVPCRLPALADATPTTAFEDFGSIVKPFSAVWNLPTAPVRGGALFLHGWSGDRTGPHRLFTSCARLLTQKGILCLRPDFIGRGLSGGKSGEASIALMAENAQTALDYLRQHLPSGAPIAVIGICSGCKVALTLAACNQDIAKLLLWSAESMGSLRSPATGLRKTINVLNIYMRKLLKPEIWRKIMTGRVQTGMVAKALVSQEKRSAEEAHQEDAVLKHFRSYRNQVCFVFGGSDPDAAGSLRAYERYCRINKIPHQVRVIPHAGHSFYSEPWTRELFETSIPFLSGEYIARSPG